MHPDSYCYFSLAIIARSFSSTRPSFSSSIEYGRIFLQTCNAVLSHLPIFLLLVRTDSGTDAIIKIMYLAAKECGVESRIILGRLKCFILLERKQTIRHLPGNHPESQQISLLRALLLLVWICKMRDHTIFCVDIFHK